jgi:hypothetical protein
LKSSQLRIIEKKKSFVEKYIILKNVSRIRKMTFYIHFAWVLLKATKKAYLVTGANNSYGGYPTNLEAEPKTLKKIIGTPNLQIKTINFSKKLCFVP